jgi:hypothetical protein
MKNLVECNFLVDVCLKGTEINTLGEAEFYLREFEDSES